MGVIYECDVCGEEVYDDCHEYRWVDQMTGSQHGETCYCCPKCLPKLKASETEMVKRWDYKAGAWGPYEQRVLAAVVRLEEGIWDECVPW